MTTRRRASALASSAALLVAVALPAGLAATSAAAAGAPSAAAPANRVPDRASVRLPATGALHEAKSGVHPNPILSRWGPTTNRPVPREASDAAAAGQVTTVSGSYNWAGIIDTGTTFSGASGSWTVPAAQPSTRPSTTPELSASWVGVGGATTGTSPGIVQTGTTSWATGPTTGTYAWVELYPAPPMTIATPVAPGDHMTAAVSQVAGDLWQVQLEDLTQHWSFTETFLYTGPTGSAEWVQEAPENATASTTTTPVFFPLADFGSVRFTTIAVTAAEPAATAVTECYMLSHTSTLRIVAYPTAVDLSGGRFSVDYGTPAPTVSSVSPSQGSTAGGTTVTITGTYLVPVPGFVTSIHFGSSLASGTISPAGVITVKAPPGSPGTVDVTVTTADGTSAPVAASGYTYVAPPVPPPAPTSGYDLVGSDGGVFVFSPPGTSGGFYGSLPGLGIQVDDVVGMVPTATDQGYFLVGSDGGVFAFGNAPFLGSLPGIGVTPSQPIAGIVPTGTDGGYFLVGRDGGVFAFGNAPFLGSLPSIGVHTDDVVGIATTPSGNGYWLVTGTGTVYAFGAARQLGSATGSPSPVAAIAGTPTGGGYWIVTQNGSVYAFGSAQFYGSLPGLGVSPAKPVVGIVHTAGTGGYWLIGADGGIFAFGDAGFVGSLPGLGVSVGDIVGAVPTQS